MVEAIGWLSSAILLLTLGKQVYKQWQTRSAEGVSKWLYYGEMAAAGGFVIYSWLIHSWVFVFTNALAFFSGVAGALIHARNKRMASRDDRRPLVEQPA